MASEKKKKKKKKKEKNREVAQAPAKPLEKWIHPAHRDHEDAGVWFDFVDRHSGRA